MCTDQARRIHRGEHDKRVPGAPYSHALLINCVQICVLREPLFAPSRDETATVNRISLVQVRLFDELISLAVSVENTPLFIAAGAPRIICRPLQRRKRGYAPGSDDHCAC